MCFAKYYKSASSLKVCSRRIDTTPEASTRTGYILTAVITENHSVALSALLKTYTNSVSNSF